MKGKSVSTGSPNSGTELIAHRLLAANGMTVGDVQQKKASLPETVEGMKDGSIQGMVWSGGLPTGGVKDLVASLGVGKLRFLDLTKELPAMQAEYGDAYQAGTIPASTYGTRGAVRTIVVPNLLLVSNEMSDDLAGKLARLIFDKKAELEKIHPEAKNITLERAAKTGDVPLHPGAEKVLTDLGARR
jgi:TRAP transporter TAXI family solute receptor